MVFTSSDRLHAKTVPLFLRADQVFLPGADLKADLKRLDEYFSAQPQEVLEEGMIHFELPAGDDYLTTRLWNQFLPGWSKRRGQKKDVNLTKEAEAKLVDEIWQTLRSPEAPSFDPDDAQFIALQRIYPAKMGKWRILSERVERESHEFERKQRNEPK
jgi:hypothetical protein